MKGYLNDDKANAETFTKDGWMRTGDVAKYDSKHGEFFIIDRIKELIKYKGFQVAPAGSFYPCLPVLTCTDFIVIRT